MKLDNKTKDTAKMHNFHELILILTLRRKCIGKMFYEKCPEGERSQELILAFTEEEVYRENVLGKVL